MVNQTFIKKFYVWPTEHLHGVQDIAISSFFHFEYSVIKKKRKAQYKSYYEEQVDITAHIMINDMLSLQGISQYQSIEGILLYAEVVFIIDF